MIISCGSKQQLLDCPPCEKEKEYVNVYMPVNTCVIDNLTIYIPSQLKPFHFVEKNGIITMDDESIKNMMYNFQVLVTERDMYYEMLQKLKKR